MKTPVEEFIERLKDERQRLLEDICTNSDLLSRLEGIRGRRWVSIRKLERKIGMLYVAKRHYGRHSRCRKLNRCFVLPCVVEWTAGGWKEIIGHLNRSTGIDDTIMVWN